MERERERERERGDGWDKLGRTYELHGCGVHKNRELFADFSLCLKDRFPQPRRVKDSIHFVLKTENLHALVSHGKFLDLASDCHGEDISEQPVLGDLEVCNFLLAIIPQLLLGN